MLIWVLVLGVVLAALTAFALSSARNRSVSAAVATAETRNRMLLNNVDSYAQRLLNVHADQLASAVAPLTYSAFRGHADTLDASMVARHLQEQADSTFCERLSQTGATSRVAFSDHVCGQATSVTVALPSVTATSTGGSLVAAPYAVVSTTPTGAQSTSRGVLRFVTGTAPVSAYALYRGGDAVLAADVRVLGPSYVQGAATLQGEFTSTTLAVSGCTVPGGYCQAQGGLRFGDGQVRSSMALVPSAGHPCLTSGCLSGTLTSPVTVEALQSVTPRILSVLLPNFNRVLLGLGNSGEQRITLCNFSGCSSYVMAGTTLTNELGMLLTSSFDGIFAASGDVRVEPEVAGSPSVSENLTVQAGGTLTVNGDLRLSDSPCPAGGDCTLQGDNPSNLLGLIAGGTVQLNADAVDAAINAGGSVLGQSGGTKLLGSVAAQQTTTNLDITHDPRLAAPVLLRPKGFPLLSAAAHLVSLQDGQ
ncbi:hypothetical protein [Deinococcus ruber]|uniref:Uncharacterized protein n=1 Tax=Deinococcus ruber TaxID=1848197 RepID=A0A918C6Y0_9DEIO|nr:hypothetical protein [Deinococcus ruber]GGR09926.1 hypothetical protein GCM10008957_23370 [Deinococcus ruber]